MICDRITLEQLEHGECLSNMRKHKILPTDNLGTWRECYLISDGNDYYMYDEGDSQPLFTAKRCESGDFYVSQYSDFPKKFDFHSNKRRIKDREWFHNCSKNLSGSMQQPNLNRDLGFGNLAEEKMTTRRYCCTLKADKSRSQYRLYSCSCELCDNFLNKFRCDIRDTNFTDERQLLAKITHGFKLIKSTNVIARTLSIKLPAILDGIGIKRAVWCPRTMAIRDKPRLDQEINQGKSIIDFEGEREQCDDATDCIQQDRENCQYNPAYILANDMDASVELRNTLPSWNERLGSLVLKFHNERIKEPSAKNFVVAEGDKVVVQTGKLSLGRFSIDFTYPVSPIQAFAIALSVQKFLKKC